MKLRSAILAATFAATATLAAAQEMPMEGPVPTSALIRADSKSHQPLNPALLKLEVNGHETPISSVTPLRPGAAQIAILIDDALRASASTSFNDIKQFITSLPAGTQVMVGYMQNGTVRSEGFSADHAAVAHQIRMPLGSPGISASPYFCLSDFVKRWPGGPAAPGSGRFVLMITNGVDPYNGSTSPLNQDSPYVQTAQNDAQRAGVAVYAIYYGDRGARGANANFSGQSYLQQVADATGGESFYQGLMNPVSFKPYLDEFRQALTETYDMTFMASTSHEKRNTLTPIKLHTTQEGVKVHAPQAVHPGTTD